MGDDPGRPPVPEVQMFEPFFRLGDKRIDDETFLQTLGALLDPSEGSVALRYCGLANAAALLWWYLPDLNWAGFYLRDDDGDIPILRLGPFQGLPACTSIPFGKGVCGTAASTGLPQVVADVHAFAGHISCDSASRSELVVPIFLGGDPRPGGAIGDPSQAVVGVIDLDSPLAGRFEVDDASFVERVANVLGEKLFPYQSAS